MSAEYVGLGSIVYALIISALIIFLIHTQKSPLIILAFFYIALFGPLFIL